MALVLRPVGTLLHQWQHTLQDARMASIIETINATNDKMSLIGSSREKGNSTSVFARGGAFIITGILCFEVEGMAEMEKLLLRKEHVGFKSILQLLITVE